MNRWGVFLLLLCVVLVTGCLAGWLNPTQPGFVIQSFTSYDAITGNNSGTIVTNGNSYQFAGDNTGTVYLGGPGTQFRGNNDGAVYVDDAGSFILGSYAALSSVTNLGKGSLILGDLHAGQKATITDVGNASLLLGAGTVSNSQAIVVGDGNVSHGSKSITANSMWAMGSGFHGSGAGLVDVPTDLTRYAAVDGEALSGRVDVVEVDVAEIQGGLVSNTWHFVVSDQVIYVTTNGNDALDGRTVENAKLTIGAGVDAAGTNWTVLVGDGRYVLTGQVVVRDGIAVRSVNGPDYTIVDGGNTTRCFWVWDSTLEGLGITGGYVFNDDGAAIRLYGGVIRNCRIYGNHADGTTTAANGGGIAALMDEALIENCVIYSNTAYNNGGGIEIRVGGEYQWVRNCLIYGNTADWGGGIYAGIYGISLNTCIFEHLTVSGNTATGTGGGGVFLWESPGYTVPMTNITRNCIIYGNTGATDPNLKVEGGVTLTVSHTCVTPAVAGDGNITNAPGFLGAVDFQIGVGSACINAGTNLAWMTEDLLGNPRVAGGQCDMGAYESRVYPAALEGMRGEFVRVTAPVFDFGDAGYLTVLNGTQLVFVAGDVTNVLDGDTLTP